MEVYNKMYYNWNISDSGHLFPFYRDVRESVSFNGGAFIPQDIESEDIEVSPDLYTLNNEEQLVNFISFFKKEEFQYLEEGKNLQDGVKCSFVKVEYIYSGLPSVSIGSYFLIDFHGGSFTVNGIEKSMLDSEDVSWVRNNNGQYIFKYLANGEYYDIYDSLGEIVHCPVFWDEDNCLRIASKLGTGKKIHYGSNDIYLGGLGNISKDAFYVTYKNTFSKYLNSVSFKRRQFPLVKLDKSRVLGYDINVPTVQWINVFEIYEDRPYNLKKKKYDRVFKNVFIEEKFVVNGSVGILNNTPDDTPIEEIFERKFKEIKFITPSEYYGSDEFNSGGVRNELFINGVSPLDKPIWWWSESLKNWCTFRYSNLYTIVLSVWDGVSGWDDFTRIVSKNVTVGYVKERYLYDVSEFYPATEINSQLKSPNVLFEYKSIKFPFDTKFSHYDTESFQTIRLPVAFINKDKVDRFPFSVGIPPISRSRGGELMCVYYLKIPSSSLKQDFTRREDINFINSVCLSFFGSGIEKGMENDWKRFHSKGDWSEEVPSEIYNESNSTLLFKEEILDRFIERDGAKMKFSVGRQYIDSRDRSSSDYLEKWGK